MNKFIVESKRITDGMFEQGLHRIKKRPQRVTVNERPAALVSNTAEASEIRVSVSS